MAIPVPVPSRIYMSSCSSHASGTATPRWPCREWASRSFPPRALSDHPSRNAYQVYILFGITRLEKKKTRQTPSVPVSATSGLLTYPHQTRTPVSCALLGLLFDLAGARERGCSQFSVGLTCALKSSRFFSPPTIFYPSSCPLQDSTLFVGVP